MNKYHLLLLIILSAVLTLLLNPTIHDYNSSFESNSPSSTELDSIISEFKAENPNLENLKSIKKRTGTDKNDTYISTKILESFPVSKKGNYILEYSVISDRNSISFDNLVLLEMYNENGNKIWESIKKFNSSQKRKAQIK